MCVCGVPPALCPCVVPRDVVCSTGSYLVPFGRVGTPIRAARDAVLARRLWDWTVEACDLRGSLAPELQG